MNSDQIRSRIIDDIFRLDWFVATWRALNGRLPAGPSSPYYNFAKKYFFFIDEFKWMSLVYSVIRLIAVTNDSDADCSTLGKLIGKLIEENQNHPASISQLRNIKRRYNQLKNSQAYDSAKVRRSKYYAHNVTSTELTSESSYTDLFELMKGFVSIFDELGSSGFIRRRGIPKYGDIDIDQLMQDALNALQSDAMTNP